MLLEFESIAENLQNAFKRSQRSNHPGIKGKAREHAIFEEFLQQYLPKRYAVSSGQVIDASGKLSNEQDLVIYDEFSSAVLQDMHDNKIFFAEQVFASIEVKSILNNEAIENMVDKASNIGSLKRTNAGLARLAPGFSVQVNTLPILYFGFAYTSPLRLEAIRDNFEKYTSSKSVYSKVSTVVILSDVQGDAGLVTNIDTEEFGAIRVDPTPSTPFASVEVRNQGEALLHFYLLLMHGLQLSGLSIPIPDFLTYARNMGLGKVNVAVGRMGVLNLKLQQAVMAMNTALELPDEALFEAFHYILLEIKRNNISDAFSPNLKTSFILGDIPINVYSPQAVAEAVEQHARQQSSETHKKILKWFFGLIRLALHESKAIKIVEQETNIVKFYFGPDLDKFLQKQKQN